MQTTEAEVEAAEQRAKAAFDASVATKLAEHRPFIERVSSPSPPHETPAGNSRLAHLQGECAAGHKLKSGTAAESDYRKHFPEAESTDVWCTVCDAKHPAAEMSSCRECDIDYCRACISLCAAHWPLTVAFRVALPKRVSLL